MSKDQASQVYDDVVGPNDDGAQASVVRLVGHGRSVLDLGCGSGTVARSLKAIGCRVWGIDRDPEAAALAETDCEQVIVADLDVVSLIDLFEGRRFEVIVADNLLQYVRDPQRLLEQARGLLSKGGYVVLSIPNMSHGSVRLALLNGDLPASDSGLLSRSYIQHFTRSSLTDLVSHAGFSLVHIQGVPASIEDSGVPFPKDEVTLSVLELLRADPEASTYEYVAMVFPGLADELPPLATMAAALASDLEAARRDNLAFEKRTSRAEEQAGALEQERARLVARLADAESAAEYRVLAGLADVRQQLLVARDQLMHRDNDVQRVIKLYEHHTDALVESEAHRRDLHSEAMNSQDQLRQALQELEAIKGSRTWRAGLALGRLRHRQLSWRAEA